MNDSLTLNVRVWNEAIPLLYEAIIGTTHHILIQTYIGLGVGGIPVCSSIAVLN